MAFIEGIGDEVTVVASIITVMLIVITAILYRSTSFIGDWTNLGLWNFLSAEQQATNVNGESSQTREHRAAISSLVRATSSSPSSTEQYEADSGTHANAANEPQSSGLADPAPSERRTSREVQLEKPNSVPEDPEAAPPQPEGAAAAAPSDAFGAPSGGGGGGGEGEEPPRPSGGIQVRLKYLNDTERTVVSCLGETVGDFKRAHFAEELTSGRSVRLICHGQLLRDEASLRASGVRDGTVVHAHVAQQTQSPAQQQAQQQAQLRAELQAQLDLSSLLWPLLSVILGVCWVLYMRYPDFFSLTSAVLLVAFSVSFLVVFVHANMQPT